MTCTAAGAHILAALAPDAERVRLVYHGLDGAALPGRPRARARRAPAPTPRDPVRLLSVGRAVEKKGYDDLLEALALLPADLPGASFISAAGRCSPS